MESDKRGALPAQMLQALMEQGHILGGTDAHISPASLDLTLSSELYEVRGLILPRVGETIRNLLPLMEPVAASLSEPLQAGKLYLIKLNEALALPADVYGYCNPKSSTGRLDMHVRVLADGVPRYDSITPSGYQGELWLAIHPQSFSVQVHEGTPLTQLRLFTADTRFTPGELTQAME